MKKQPNFIAIAKATLEIEDKNWSKQSTRGLTKVAYIDMEEDGGALPYANFVGYLALRDLVPTGEPIFIPLETALAALKAEGYTDAIVNDLELGLLSIIEL